MIVHSLKNAQIIFGNSKQAIIPQEHFDSASAESLTQIQPISLLCSAIGASSLCMAHQIHGFDGLTISAHNLPKPWAHDADYLITAARGVTIGIATADCIPLLLYDPEHEVIAAIHAGWKGMAAGIIEKALADMCTNFHSNLPEIQAWIGPAARKCCYQVSLEVIEACKAPPEAICKNNNTLYLDLIETTVYRLQKAGLASHSITTEGAECTICSPHYNSHRRDNTNLYRQLSLISLQK
jgi:YfiH family protein